MTSRQLPILPILLLVTTAASAGQAYTWTDDAGTTHFSDSPPANAASNAEQVNLPPVPVTPTVSPDRYQSINEQADRLQADRLQREQQREQRRQKEAKKQQERARIEQRQQAYSSTTYPYYPRYGWYPGHRPPHHPHYPGHHRYPPARPGFQPGKTITQKRNQEALRNHRYRW